MADLSRFTEHYKPSGESIEEQLKKLVPKSLDDVVRKNQDQLRLALATQEELETLAADISATNVRHIITCWQFVAMHATTNRGPVMSVRLFGWAEEVRESWSTSDVTGVDLTNGLVRTANSIYRISGPRAMVDELDLLHVCASLHSWGLGEHFGVPHIFY